VQDQHALVVEIGVERRAEGGEKEKTKETAEHEDLDAASSGAACVFPLRRTSANWIITRSGNFPHGSKSPALPNHQNLNLFALSFEPLGGTAPHGLRIRLVT
jgi:hypothetical protein